MLLDSIDLNHRQEKPWSCGAACVFVMLKALGLPIKRESTVRRMLKTNKDGTTPERIVQALTDMGYKTELQKTTARKMRYGLPRAMYIVLANCSGFDHYILIYHVRRKKKQKTEPVERSEFLVYDPLGNISKLSEKQLTNIWHSTSADDRKFYKQCIKINCLPENSMLELNYKAYKPYIRNHE